MSNMNDAISLRTRYGKSKSQYETEYEPATGTLWSFFKPKGNACFNLGLLKDIREHDSALAANGGRIEVDGELQNVTYYVLG